MDVIELTLRQIEQRIKDLKDKGNMSIEEIEKLHKELEGVLSTLSTDIYSFADTFKLPEEKI